jgi:hypothetical protein
MAESFSTAIISSSSLRSSITPNEVRRIGKADIRFDYNRNGESHQLVGPKYCDLCSKKLD